MGLGKETCLLLLNMPLNEVGSAWRPLEQRQARWVKKALDIQQQMLQSCDSQRGWISLSEDI